MEKVVKYISPLSNLPIQEPSSTEQRIAAAVKAEREACAMIAEGVLGSVSPIGPLMSAGLNEAAKHIAGKIRERSR